MSLRVTNLSMIEQKSYMMEFLYQPGLAIGRFATLWSIGTLRSKYADRRIYTE